MYGLSFILKLSIYFSKNREEVKWKIINRNFKKIIRNTVRDGEEK